MFCGFTEIEISSKLIPKKEIILIKLQAFRSSKVAGFFEEFILSNVPKFPDLFKLLAPTRKKIPFSKIPGFYCSFSNSSLWDVCKASGKLHLKRGPLYNATARRSIRNRLQ